MAEFFYFLQEEPLMLNSNIARITAYYEKEPEYDLQIDITELETTNKKIKVKPHEYKDQILQATKQICNNPDNVSAYTHRAHAYIAIGPEYYEQALSDLDNVIDLDPAPYRAHALRADLLNLKGQLVGARVSAKRGVELLNELTRDGVHCVSPHDSYCYALLAEILLNTYLNPKAQNTNEEPESLLQEALNLLEIAHSINQNDEYAKEVQQAIFDTISNPTQDVSTSATQKQPSDSTNEEPIFLPDCPWDQLHSLSTPEDNTQPTITTTTTTQQTPSNLPAQDHKSPQLHPGAPLFANVSNAHSFPTTSLPPLPPNNSPVAATTTTTAQTHDSSSCFSTPIYSKDVN